MTRELTLSVLDQSPMRKGGTAAEALRNTVLLAKAIDRLGYERFWVAEHHNGETWAGTSPEILVGQILANTKRVRVGSGGVMLSHYSALKVAEQFRVLDSFYPGRVDLGIGRAPGSDQLTANALAYPKMPADIQQFPQQVADLIGHLYQALDPQHPFSSIHAYTGPTPESAPEIWLLGSSAYSAQLAATLGLSFGFADFFGNLGEVGPVVADLYRTHFRPSQLLQEPRVLVALQVLCAPTREEAVRLGASRNLNKAGSVLGLRGGLLPPDEAAVYPLTEAALKWQEEFRKGYIDGDPQQVKQEILEIAERYSATDVSLVTITYDLRDKIRSYDLVSQAFGLVPRALKATPAAGSDKA